MRDLFLYAFLSASVCMDLYWWKIKNEFIVISFISILFFHLLTESPVKILYHTLSMCLILIILFPLYIIRAIGAGDVKVFGILAFLIGGLQALNCIVVSFAIGAVMALFKMLYHKNLKLRYCYLCYYFKYHMKEDQFKSYHLNDHNKKSMIHFTIPIFLGTIINYKCGGIIWKIF